MPFTRNSELPPEVRQALPSEAQDVFRSVANQVLDRGLPEDRALASAWAAVKRGWKKTADGWVRKMVEQFEHVFEISKVDEDRNLVFGWAYVAEKADGQTVVDHSDEFAKADAVERMAYEYVLLKRAGGEMHSGRIVGDLVESVVTTREKQRAMGLSSGALPVGHWVGFRVKPDVFAKVKNGTYKALSIGGRAKKLQTVA